METFYSDIVLCFGIFIYIAYGQTENIGCPSGWVKSSSNNRCYKFIDDAPRIYEEADAVCWKDGAALLGINDEEEHEFISTWLFQNDILPPSTWLTSGYFSNGIIIWESEDRIYRTRVNWKSKSKLRNEGRIAYHFGGADTDGYEWTLVPDSIPLSYICEISISEAASIGFEQRGEDYGYGIVDPAELPRGPEIINQPESIVVVENGLPVYIECTSHGNPYPSFTWFRGENLDEEITQETDRRYTLSGGRFTISNPRTDDVNSYRCLAINEIGMVMSQVTKIQFGYLHEFPPLPDADVHARAFRGVRLECNTPAYYPEVRFEWSKFGTAAFVSPGHKYQFVSMAGYLYMSEVQPTDGKKYYCFVTLTAPNNYKLTTKQPPTRISLGVWLQISEETYVANYGPIINTHAFPSPALRGLTIRLECIAYGTLPITYTWKRTGDRDFVSGTKISDRGRVLTIVNAPLDAEGGYICTATGKAGVAHKTISVVMETEPYFPYGIGSMFVDPEQTVMWRCKAVARPRATYAWYKNGQLLETVPGEVEVRGHMLYIRSVQKQRDEGMYQCAATNLHGTTFSTGRLKVVSFKPNFDKHPLPPITLAPLGGTITIPCKVEAAPAPQVSWLKNGVDLKQIAEVSGRVHILPTYELVLSAIDYTDTGSYTCEASNINGQAFNKTYLRIVDGVVITVPPTSTTVQVNNTAFLYCQAAPSNRYDVTYTWKFNGHPIDFHRNAEYVLSQNYGTHGMYIVQAQFTNTGVYECVAETTLDSTSRAASLSVMGTPGSPAGVYADPLSVTPYTVRLVWTVGPGIHHGDPISFYDVEGETSYRSGEWREMAVGVPESEAVEGAINAGDRADQRSMTLQTLLPYTAYRFRIRAVNGFGRGKEASQPTAVIQTPETLPTVVPSNVGGGGGKVGTLTVEWDPLDASEHCGPGLGYNIYWKRYGEKQTDWKKETVTHENAKRIWTRDGERKAIFTATVGPDNYYLEYEVKVGAYNIHGDGPNSTVFIIYSAEGMPVAVPTILDPEDVNSTAAIINWIPVSDDRETMKGRVRGYTVQYFLADDDFSLVDGKEPDNVQTKEIYGQTDHCQIIGLIPDSDYYARVQVFNTAGRGPKGHWRPLSTAKKSPRTRPTNINVYPRTEQSVTVTWRGVSIGNEEESLRGYKLFLWKVPEDIRSCEQIQVGKVTETVIHMVQKKTVYALRVLAYSDGGNGKLSELIYFTVLGGNIPLDPTTSQICYPGDTSRQCSDGYRLGSSVLLNVMFSVLSTVLVLTG